MAWWAGMAAGSLAFMLVVPRVMPIWHTPYIVLFLFPLWMTAAFGMELVAEKLGDRRLVVLWYGCVAVLLLPGLVSYYRDGSRKDVRQAARIVAQASEPGTPILTNAILETKYYLPTELRSNVRFWYKTDSLPPAQCMIVYGSSNWEPVLRFPGRNTEVIGQVGRRRYDEYSNVVRVYRVGPAAAGSFGVDPAARHPLPAKH